MIHNITESELRVSTLKEWIILECERIAKVFAKLFLL